MFKISYHFRVDNLVTPQDVASPATVNTNTGMYRSMKEYDLGCVVVIAHLTNTKTAIAQLTSSNAAAAGDKKNVTGFAVTLTGTTTVPEQVGVIDFKAIDLYELDTDNTFVGCDITTNQAGDDVGAVLVRGGARYYEGSAMDA